MKIMEMNELFKRLFLFLVLISLYFFVFNLILIVKHQQATAMITPTVSAGQASSRPSSAKSDSSKSPATSSDEGDSEYISYSDGSSEGTVLFISCGNANIVIYSNKR